MTFENWITETCSENEPAGIRNIEGPVGVAAIGPWRRTLFYGEFDPGSGLTLAACLTHASRAGEQSPAADG